MSQILCVGIAVLDDIYRIPMTLQPGAKHRAATLTTTIGGTATNGAFAIARLGGKPLLLTRFGDDAGMPVLRAMLHGYGIDLSLSLPLAGHATSRSTIVVEPNGERTIINILDPTLPDAPDWLPTELPSGCDGVLGDVRWEYAAKRMFLLARRAGKPAVLDGDRAPTDLSLIEAATHAIFSAQGLREMTGVGHLPDALAKLASDRGLSGAKVFLGVTDGAAGVFTFSMGQVAHYPAFAVQQVDSLGAGDTWHGAFALAVAEGQSMEAAIRFANAAAAIKVTRVGGPLGAPTRAEVNDFLQENAA
jgi:sulfofructose kinase